MSDLEKLRALEQAGLWSSIELMSSFIPQKDEVKLLVARSRIKLRDYRRAIEDLEELAESMGEGKVAADMMRCYEKLELWKEALEWGEKIPTKSAKVWARLAVLQERLGNKKAASKCWTSVIRECEWASEGVESLCRLGVSQSDIQTFLSKRNVPPVMLDLAKLWEIARNDPRSASKDLMSLPWNGEGSRVGKKMASEMLWQAGDYEQCLLLDPSPDVAALSVWRAGRDSRLGRLCESSRGTPAGWTALAVLCGARGDFARGAMFAAKGASEARERGCRKRAHAVAGHCLAMQGRWKEAEEQYELAEDEGLQGLLRCMAQQGRAQDALRRAKQQYRTQPSSERVLSSLAFVLSLYPSARAKCRQVLERCIRAGGPRAQYVVPMATCDDDGGVSLLRRAVLGGPHAAAAALVPERCLEGVREAHLAFARALVRAAEKERSPEMAQEALAQLRTAAALGPMSHGVTQLQLEVSRATRLLAPRDEQSDDEGAQGGIWGAQGGGAGGGAPQAGSPQMAPASPNAAGAGAGAGGQDAFNFFFF